MERLSKLEKIRIKPKGSKEVLTIRVCSNCIDKVNNYETEHNCLDRAFCQCTCNVWYGKVEEEGGEKYGG
jgi:hypothetical protein